MLRLSIILPVFLALTGGLAAAVPAPVKPLASPPALKARGAGDAPAIELAEAVANSRAYAGSHHIDLGKQYLQSASFDFVKRLWKVVWQMPNAKGGYTEFTVPESGAIGVQYGE
jgi:hypothetical protein